MALKMTIPPKSLFAYFTREGQTVTVMYSCYMKFKTNIIAKRFLAKTTLTGHFAWVVDYFMIPKEANIFETFPTRNTNMFLIVGDISFQLGLLLTLSL